MFSVYGVSGRLFMGAASDMPQVPGVRSLLRSRPVGAIGLDPSASETGENQRRAATPTPPPGVRALAAYDQGTPTQRRPLQRVQDVMTSQPTIFVAGMPAAQALQVLQEQDWAQAPVVSEQSVLTGLLLADSVPVRPDASVADLMMSPVPSVLPDTDLRQLARVLLDTGLNAMPVVDAQGAVVGLVARSDLLRAMAHEPPLDLWS